MLLRKNLDNVGVAESTSVFRVHPCHCLYSITMFCFAHRDRSRSRTFAHRSFVSNRLLVWLITTGCASSRDVRQLCASIGRLRLRLSQNVSATRGWGEPESITQGLDCLWYIHLDNYTQCSSFHQFRTGF